MCSTVAPAMSGALMVTSSSVNALAVGANGATNPAFQVNASAASAATGIIVTGQAAGGGGAISVMSSVANENMVLYPKGTGSIILSGPVSLATTLTVSGAASVGGALAVTGNLTVSGVTTTCWNLNSSGTIAGNVISCAGNLTIQNTSPTITFYDTDWSTRRLTHDGGWLGILRNDNAQWDFRCHNGGTVDIAAGFTAAGNVTAYSDETLKDDIRTIPNALATVRTMRGVHYTMKKTKEKGSGVIAQEMEQSAPELVGKTPEGILTFAYGNLVGYLIEALKQLADRVDEIAPPLKSTEPSA